MRVVALLLSLPSAAWLNAETGGLQSLPAPVYSSNAILNGGFEEGSAAAWNLGRPWTVADQTARTGSRALAITGAGSSWASATQTITAAGMRVLRLRAWLKTSGDPGPDAAFVIGINCQTDRGFGVASGHTRPLSLGGGLSEWTQFTLQDNIAWGAIHYGHRLQIALQASNIAAGVTLWIDDVTVEPVHVPLTIFPIYPNYRGMLWPDQGLTVKWNAIVDPAGKAVENLRVRTEIVAAGGSVAAASVLDTLALPRHEGGLNAQWPGLSTNPQSFDASALPDGVYYLRGKLLDASGAVLYTYPDYKIVKEDPSVQRAQWKAWVDRYNRAVLDGRPRFIWGGFLQPNFATNTYVNGRADPYLSPESYKAIAFGNPPFSYERPSLLHSMQDLKMNADVYYSSLSVANIGISYNVSGTGEISASGTAVTGVRTTFTKQLQPGDTIHVREFPGTGVITTYGEKVRGSGTHFTQELRPFDWVLFPGNRLLMVAEIVSDTELWLQSAAPAATDAPWRYQATRTVVSIESDTALTINEPFLADISSMRFGRTSCSAYNPQLDYLSPYISAAAELDIWHLQITANFHRRDPNLPTWAKYCRIDGPKAVTKLLTHAPDPLAGRAGWLGTYVADEPSPDHPAEGRLASFQRAQAAAQAGENTLGRSFGGINYWVDGVMPLQTWNQWANFMDAGGPDPYPVGFGPVADDVVYGMPTGRLHGRSYWWPRRVADGQFDARPLWTTIQLFRATAAAGLPRPADQKIQVVSALAAGSTGILWWTLVGNTGLGSVATPEYYTEWRRGAQVIAGLMPLLEQPIEDLAARLDGEPEYGRLIASVSDPAVRCSSRQSEGRILLACANTGSAAVTATITMRDPLPAAVHKPWDGSAVEPQVNAFTVSFSGLQDLDKPADSVQLFLIESRRSIVPARVRRR
jgi:hypothetical protein